MTAYYNEHDPEVAAWLRELIRRGLIAPGVVDERSIEDVCPKDIEEFTQCHFFAGIGVWSYALRAAGWPDVRRVWTASCPCQPFSEAGGRAGFVDERHLWPALHWLVAQSRPGVLFGEQVAATHGDAWLDVVSTDMEALDYAIGPIVLPAAGFGAPHPRHRIFFVAESAGRLADASGARLQTRQDDGASRAVSSTRPRRFEFVRDSAAGSRHVGDAGRSRLSIRECEAIQRSGRWKASRAIIESGRASLPTNGFWKRVDWIDCQDNKARPVEPGTFPLADGASARVVRIRSYGNAINAEVAKEFVAAYMTISGAE